MKILGYDLQTKTFAYDSERIYKPDGKLDVDATIENNKNNFSMNIHAMEILGIGQLGYMVGAKIPSAPIGNAVGVVLGVSALLVGTPILVVAKGIGALKNGVDILENQVRKQLSK